MVCSVSHLLSIRTRVALTRHPCVKTAFVELVHHPAPRPSRNPCLSPLRPAHHSSPPLFLLNCLMCCRYFLLCPSSSSLLSSLASSYFPHPAVLADGVGGTSVRYDGIVMPRKALEGR
jgi:hypothetical protein